MCASADRKAAPLWASRLLISEHGLATDRDARAPITTRLPGRRAVPQAARLGRGRPDSKGNAVMAYLDLTMSASTATPVSMQFDSAADAFERREWEIIALARQDGLSSLRAPGRLERAAAWLFGGGINRRLADPRLEALRRLAVLAWHNGYALPVSAIKAFKAAGFSMDQLEIVLARISAGRASFNRRIHA